MPRRTHKKNKTRNAVSPGNPSSEKNRAWIASIYAVIAGSVTDKYTVGTTEVIIRERHIL